MSDISKIHINPTGGDHNIKDATARNAIQSSKTLKSSVVTVPDAAPINAEDITVDITPIQDLHGYDRPWAGGAWKNKLKFFTETKTSRAGTVVIPQSNGRYNWSGSNTTSAHIIEYPLNVYQLSGRYRFVIDNYSQVALAYSNISVYYDDNGTTKALEPNQVIDLNNNLISIAFFAKPGQTFNYTNIGLMFIAENESTTFAPYSNICPIEGWTGAELDRVGKNWLPKSQTASFSVNGVTVTNNNDGTYTTANSASAYGVCKVLAGKTIRRGSYILSGGFTATDGVSVMLTPKNNDSVNIARSYGGDVAFTLDTDTEIDMYFTFRTHYPYAPTTIAPMIRLASVADSTYEPYQGQQYTISFGETVYGGKWHVTEGGTDKTHGYLTENSIDGVSIGTSGGGLHWYDISLYSVYNANALISNMLVEMSGDDAWYSSNACMSVNSNGKIRLYFKSSTTADAKTELNGLQIVYKLATPTTISTPKQNVPMLQGINTVSADCGDTSLKYQPDNVIGELKGEIQRANSFVSKMALREGSGAKDFSYGGWSFRLYIYRSMGQISMSVERISASSVTEQAVIKTFNGESDYRAPEYLRPIFDLIQAATYTTPSGWAIQVYLKDDGYIMFTGMAPAVGASAPTSSNWNLVEPWATHQQAKDLFNN